MRSSLMVTIVDAAGAETVLRWLPDLVAAGFRRVTLFHPLADERMVAKRLDQMRPVLDRLSLAMLSLGVDADLALKRGDAAAWLLAMAELRPEGWIVLRSRGAAPLVDSLLERSRLPVLVLPDLRPRGAPTGLSRPVLVSGDRDEEVQALSWEYIREPIAVQASQEDLPRDAGLVILGPPGRTAPRVVELAAGATCPVLFVPARALHAAARSSSSPR